MDMGPTHLHQEEFCTHLLAPTVFPVGAAPGVGQETEWVIETSWTVSQTETSRPFASRNRTIHFSSPCLSYYFNWATLL